jgi:hypothetical protein
MGVAVLYAVFLGGAFVLSIGLYKVFRGLNLS